MRPARSASVRVPIRSLARMNKWITPTTVAIFCVLVFVAFFLYRLSAPASS